MIWPLTRQACPENDLLDGFIHGRLPQSESLKIETHVERCTECQNILDELTAPEDVPNLTDSGRRVWNRIFETATHGLSTSSTQLKADTDPKVRFTSPLEAVQTPAFSIPELPGYTILEQIGKGGMGTVYRARQEKLVRDVAIKFMQPKGGELARERFSAEMAAVGNLKHEHIVQAYDAGEVDGVPYLVMELLDGSDMSEFVNPAKRLPVETICKYGAQAAQGLQAAHNNGILHRDIKPSNLLVTSEGRLKLLDMGLAGVAKGNTPTTKNTVTGSLDYLAPEQAQNFESADERSDIYALGCTLFALLTGRPLFSGADYKKVSRKLLAHLDATRPDLQSLRPDVPHELSNFVGQMVSPDPNQRPATATEVAEILDSFSTSESSHSRKLLFGVLAGLMLAGFVIKLKYQDGTEKHIEVEQGVTEISITGLNKDAAVSVEQPKFDFASNPYYIRTLSDQFGSVMASCFLPDGEHAFATYRNKKCILWNWQTGEIVKEFSLSIIPKGGGLIALDNEHVCMTGGGGMGVFSLVTGAYDWTVGSQSNLQIEVSPTGLIAQSTFNGIFLRTAKQTRLKQFHKFTRSPDFNSSGELLCYVSGEEQAVVIYSVEEAEDIQRLASTDFSPKYVRFVPDDKHIIAIDRSKRRVTWDVTTGKVVRDDENQSISWQHQLMSVGKLNSFVTLCESNKLTIFNPLTGTSKPPIKIPTSQSFSVSPDGQHAISMEVAVNEKGATNSLHLWKLSLE